MSELLKNVVYMLPKEDSELGDSSPIRLDMLEDFSPAFSATVTKYKVSDKSNISNHRFLNNTVITLSGYVSNQPLTQHTDNAIGYESSRNRVATAYHLIKYHFEKGTTFDVANKWDVFADCQITDFKPIQSGLNSILISITLEQVKRASYQRVTLINTMSENKKKDAAPNTRKKEGASEGTEVTEVNSESNNLDALDKYVRNKTKMQENTN